MRLISVNFLLIAAAFLLNACVSAGPSDLGAGASTADVIARMGKPSSELPLPDGGRQLEYVRGPCGPYTFMVNVGRDGKVRNIEQVLHNKFFEKVQPGMTEADILALLGHPGRVLQLERINKVVWHYRYTEAGMDDAWFNVHYDLGGKVTGTDRRYSTFQTLCDFP